MTGEPTNAATGAHLVYAAMVTYLTEKGWRREELGSGWWWHEIATEDVGLGGAVEEQLRADGIDLRTMLPGEPQEFWG